MADDTTLDLPDQIEMREALSDIVHEKPRALNMENISPELIDVIKAQVVAEMQNDDKRKEEEDRIRRETQRKEHDDYVARMKASPDPWVEIEGWVETSEGVKVELEWNEPFVEHLKSKGISGSDEDQVVQKWIAMLMQDMTTKMGVDDKSEYD